MPRIPEKVIEEIKSRSDIVDIISEYVPLKPAGRAFKGHCPFHDDEALSFVVNREMQIYKCFACGEGGNVFAFLVKHEEMAFHEAVDFLAKRYDITIPGTTKSDSVGNRSHRSSHFAVEGEFRMKISVEDQKTIVKSDKFTACFDGDALVSLKSRDGGVEFLHPEAPDAPIDVFFMDRSTLGKDRHQECIVKQLSDVAVRIIVTGEDSDRSLLITQDRATGDLCVTPSGKTFRRGVVSVRWNLSFHPDADVILPCVNGILVRSDSGFPGNDRFPWPYRWNAQMIIAERDKHTCMIRSQDTSFKFKALNLSRKDTRTTLGFESETVGPLWQNNTAGGAEWRINVYPDDWKAPASQYRDWLAETYQLEARRANRPDWVDQIDFSVGWAGANIAVLDLLAEFHPPERTLIHLSDWRTDRYDHNYPVYTPTQGAIAYMKKANEMGFKVMPHFNYFSVYYKNPFYQQVRDFQIRDAYKNEPQGWHWPPDTHDYTRMAYIHPGYGIWRRKFIDVVTEACDLLNAPIAFIDQTLCTWNTDNGLVENMTTVEGMWRLQEEFSAVRPDLMLAGEGLNDISFQRECFAQGHIHDGWRDNLEQHHVKAAHPICSFLWDRHCRLVGYYHLTPGQSDTDLGIEVYKRMGAIPTACRIGSTLENIDPELPQFRMLLSP